jgi:hypothetical protein
MSNKQHLEPKNILFFNFTIQSDGSTIPSTYAHGLFSIKKYKVITQDNFTNVLWKKTQSTFVSNKDENLATKFKSKYNLS